LSSDKVEWLATGSVDTLLKQLKAVLENLKIVINARKYTTIKRKKGLVVGLIDERQSSPDPYAEATRGSLMYLLVESHSVSRHKFHEPLKTFLDRVVVAY
jgi:anaerobic ribonucleoside-triphosphate reductase